QAWQASRGGYWTAPQSRHSCSSNRPSAAAAVKPRAALLRAPGGTVGRRVRRTGFLRRGRDEVTAIPSVPAPEYGSAGADAAIVIDHAEAADEAETRLGDG